MQRIVFQESSLTPNFIGSWFIEPLSVCDELINYFETHKNDQNIGLTSSGLNLEVKDRLDISMAPKNFNLPGNEVFNNYINSLFECYKDYTIQWPYLQEIGEKIEIGEFNLGRYSPGQHFQGMHAERISVDTLHRMFAWMTYLNDVEEGGETFFSNYDLKIKPKKGLTIIWPAEWTHAHKGNILLNGSKYMITGWMDLSA